METIITKEEFKDRAKKIYDRNNGYAGETGHMEIDNLMEECLRSLGYEEGLNIIYSMSGIWYA